MKLYQELTCENYHEINDEIKIWIWSQKIQDSNLFWNPVDTLMFSKHCPLFVQWCKSSSILIKSIAVTVGHSSDCCGAHVDTPPARYKLSWPVLNTANTWNCWYKSNVDHPEKQVNILGGTSYLNPDQLIEIHRREVITPAIIDAGIIHDVATGPNAQWPRIVLQCQLFKEPDNL
jgi:hypothetical protein